MKSLRRIGFYLLLAFALVFVVEGQAQPTGDPTGDPDATPVEEVPLDGGLSLLLGAGIAYGTKRAYENRKKDKSIKLNSKL